VKRRNPGYPICRGPIGLQCRALYVYITLLCMRMYIIGYIPINMYAYIGINVFKRIMLKHKYKFMQNYI